MNTENTQVSPFRDDRESRYPGHETPTLVKCEVKVNGIAQLPTRRTGGNERGAALVEFALVLPLLMVTSSADRHGGMAYNRKLALTGAVREAPALLPR